MNETGKKIWLYFKQYRLIYIGVIICNIGAFSFYKILNISKDIGLMYELMIILFFLLSFLTPITLSIIFTIRSFSNKSKIQLLIDIIHNYAGILFIFSALYFQLSVFSGRIDAYRKDRIYTSQYKTIKEINPDYEIIKVADRRAFRGIERKLWSSYDYPTRQFVESHNDSTNHWYFLALNNFQDISSSDIQQVIEASATNGHQNTYLKRNIPEVYIDCLYFSIICMATVGFGDISPALWYAKIFVSMEVIIGLSIFVFAIGMLFSDFHENKELKQS